MSSKFCPSTMVRRAPHQVSCRLNDEIAILNLDSALYFGVDKVGARIWDTLETPHSVASLCDEIVDRFDVGPVECRQDVEKFLSRLHETGLIEIIK